MEFILDTTLEEVEFQSRYDEDAHINQLLSRTKKPGSSDWGGSAPNNSEVTETHTIPKDADLYHQSYLSYLSMTYARHQSIVLTPDIFWFTIMNEFAQLVKVNPEPFRHLFTESAGKTTIEVYGSDPLNLPITEIREQLRTLVPTNIDLFLPQFSTTEINSEMAMLSGFLDTVSPYYNYMMMLCGHPKVKVLGTEEDWNLVSENFQQITNHSLTASIPTSWFGKVEGIIFEILNALKTGNGAFFKNIFTEERCGSGGQTNVNGWWTELYLNQPSGLREITNFSSGVTRVEYQVAGIPNKAFFLSYGLFSSKKDNNGYMIPSFSRVVNSLSS